jgi:sulfoxide reductase catalytic subunit YedY
VRRFPPEERIYRLRCVEAWSMVIHWLGFHLADLLALAEPTGDARFVRFVTLLDPDQMPGQDQPAILALPGGSAPGRGAAPAHPAGHRLYGEALLPQNGAPLRLVVPWKYGFKSIKSIVRIELTAEQPATFWSTVASGEYGFYANVNPAVPTRAGRWPTNSARESDRARYPAVQWLREDVAGLYTGLDLNVYY